MKKRGPVVLDFDPQSWRMVANSATFRETLLLVQRAARCTLPVLISGEPGTEILPIAQLIGDLAAPNQTGLLHWASAADLVTSQHWDELFAGLRQRSASEPPQQDTIVIDDIELLSLGCQRLLVQYLDQQSGPNLGHNLETGRTVDPNPPAPRVIGCTRVDLRQLVTDKQFREDLYWRLSVLPIAIPPLRRRREDLPQIIEQLLLSLNGPLEKIDSESLVKLTEYAWPGNLDELNNYLKRANALATNATLTSDLLPSCVTGDSQAAATAVFRPADNPSLIREFVFNSISNADRQATNLFELIVQPVEKELLVQVMQACQNVQTRAATRLGMNRNTLYKKLKEYDLDKTDEGDGPTNT